MKAQFELNCSCWYFSSLIEREQKSISYFSQVERKLKTIPGEKPEKDKETYINPVVLRNFDTESESKRINDEYYPNSRQEQVIDLFHLDLVVL